MYKVIRADNPLTRIAGLNGTDQVNSGKTLHIVPCSGIHTFGMKYAIDAVFLNKKNRVVKVVHDLKPNRVIPLVTSAKSVLEFHAGSLWDDHIESGNELYITEDEPYKFSTQYRTWLFLLPFMLITAILWLRMGLNGIAHLRKMGFLGGYNLFVCNTLLFLHLRWLKGPRSILEKFASVFALLFAMSLSVEEYLFAGNSPTHYYLQMLGIAGLTIATLKPNKKVVAFQSQMPLFSFLHKSTRIQIILLSAVIFYTGFLFSYFSYANLASCISIVTLLFFSFVRVRRPEAAFSIR